MELIAIDAVATELERMRGLVAVAHSDTGLSRGLELDEDVVVRAGEDFHTATVCDISFSLEDTHYALRVGPRLSEEQATTRLVDAAGIKRPQGVHELLDLMAKLRREPS